MKKKNSTYMDKTHFWGSLFSVLAIVVLVSVPVSIMLNLNVRPAVMDIIKGTWGVALIFWPTAVIEVFFYTPILGAGATYLSFVTGNISNLKLPCALNARDMANTKPGTDEDEAVCTISVAVSAITTTVVLAVGVLALAPVLPKITAKGSIFAPAFNQVIPALFGALGAGYFVKHWRLSFIPIILATVILVFAPTLGTGVLIPICVIASIASALGMYVSGFLTGGVKQPNPLKELFGKK